MTTAIRKISLALCLTAVPFCALAEDAPVLAEYWTNSGSLAPEYAWDTDVIIHQDGKLTLKHCTGYETEGPACKTRRATVPEAALAAIRQAAIDSGLADAPAREREDLMVGGGATGGVVMLEGKQIKLLSQPTDADAERVGKVLQAIAAAIPHRFDHFLVP
jgi:hypothetical protein